MNFEGKSFLKLLDFTPEEISALIDLAATLKEKKKAGELVVSMIISFHLRIQKTLHSQLLFLSKVMLV